MVSLPSNWHSVWTSTIRHFCLWVSLSLAFFRLLCTFMHILSSVSKNTHLAIQWLFSDHELFIKYCTRRFEDTELNHTHPTLKIGICLLYTWHHATGEMRKVPHGDSELVAAVTSTPRALSASLTLRIVLLKIQWYIGSLIRSFIHLSINLTYTEFLLCARHLLLAGRMAVIKQDRARQSPCLTEVRLVRWEVGC